MVSGVDLGAIENGNKQKAQQHHYQRLGQVNLDEFHSIVIGLPGGSDEGDGAGLGGHDGEPDGAPGKATVGQIVTLHAHVLATVKEGEGYHGTEIEDENKPVQGGHETL